jgi:plastocyanin
MKPLRLAALAVLVGAALAISACGGDDNGGGGGNGNGGTPPAKKQGAGGGGQAASQVTLSEYKFDPDSVTATAGSTITVKNDGSLGHDLRLRQGGKEVGGTRVFDAGSSEQLKLDFKPGRYEMFCSVPGHEQLGMKGTFTIK